MDISDLLAPEGVKLRAGASSKRQALHLAAGAAAFVDVLAAAILAAVALSTVPTRQLLMPAINRATDAGQKARFARLHGLSVVVTLLHIAVAGWALVRLAA